jgi:archaellum component FlaC
MRKSDDETADLIRNHIAKMKVEMVQSGQALELAQEKIEILEKAIKKLKEIHDEDMERIRGFHERRPAKPRAPKTQQAAPENQPRLD